MAPPNSAQMSISNGSQSTLEGCSLFLSGALRIISSEAGIVYVFIKMLGQPSLFHDTRHYTTACTGTHGTVFSGQWQEMQQVDMERQEKSANACFGEQSWKNLTGKKNRKSIILLASHTGP